MRKILRGASLALVWLAAGAAGSNLWTYTGPPLAVVPGSDPALKPAGLGTHFEIQVLFPTGLPTGDLAELMHDWFMLSPQVTWKDGSVMFEPQAESEGEFPGSFAYLDRDSGSLVINLVGGLLNHPGVGSTGALGPDTLLVCGDGFDRCSSFYREQAAPGATGTWTFATVPEPGTLPLFMSGAALAYWALRRRRG